VSSFSGGDWKYSLIKLSSKTPYNSKRYAVLSERNEKLLLSGFASRPLQGYGTNLWLLLVGHSLKNCDVLLLWQAKRRQETVEAVLADDSLRNLGEIFKTHQALDRKLRLSAVVGLVGEFISVERG